MDSDHFDTLVSTLGTAGTRRRLLRSSALPLVGGLAAFLNDDEESAAKKKKHKKNRCKTKAQVCADKCGIVTYKCHGKKRTADCGSCLCDVCASSCHFTSVQDAIDAADPGDTIRICRGTYTEDIRIDKALTIVGINSLNSQTVLHGTLSSLRVIAVSGGPVILKNLRITGSSGGGVENSLGGTLEMTNCVINWNGDMDMNGFGGIDNYGTLTMQSCTVSENSAVRGGGIANYAHATLTSCTVSGNLADRGGGIANDASPDFGGSLSLNNCIVSGNESTFGGGGIYNEVNASLEMTDCTVSENTAPVFGGGIYNEYDSSLEMNDCTVTGNTTSFHGGGIFNAGMVALEAGTIVTDNDAEDGGGIFNEGQFGDATSTCSGGSSVSGNTPDNCVALRGGSCGGC